MRAAWPELSMPKLRKDMPHSAGFAGYAMAARHEPHSAWPCDAEQAREVVVFLVHYDCV